MQRKLLTAKVTATCTAADLPAGSPTCSVKSEAETSTHTTAKFDRCSDWRYSRALSQSNSTRQRYRAMGQAFRQKVTLNVSSNSATMQPRESWGPSNTHLLGALQRCRESDWHGAEVPGTTNIHVSLEMRSLLNRQPNAAAAELQGSSRTQPFSVVPSGHRNVLVGQ